MTTNPQSCTNCGAALSLQDLTRPNCPYCGRVLPHHARAAEHAALVNQVLAQQVQVQNPWLGAGGVPQIPYQYGAPMPFDQQPNPYAATHAQIGQVLARSYRIVIAVTVAAVLFVVLSVGIVFLVMLW